ncbi:uncharacterized protein A1O9_06791 [Exophiala aquamarina CBS 119918]|uniref:RNB domain-containing protein n=1 Tax=Exophiala aquamarina CBS 119918 TaxID=1182545 RepID=A0A072PA15_9EURO|nr:uncharacterized protein A1O9_06791 [Exophiala aquamarina CBS 119918]KEF56602.1 hypothetical protein A1O9_06791 [Exophiala aquamarina CBS 119918]
MSPFRSPVFHKALYYIQTNHLKAWSIKNQEIKAQKAEQDYLGLGATRLTTLPNSLFIEESKVDDEGFEQDLDRDEDFADTPAIPFALQPGDLIFCRSSTAGTREQFAVYLGQEGLQFQYFLSDGRWLVDRTIDHDSPVVRGFASPDEVQAIRTHLPKQEIVKRSSVISYDLLRSWAGEVPRSASDPLLRRLALLIDEISSFRRENLALLDSVIDKVSHDVYYQTLDWDQVVHKVMACEPSNLSPATCMAVYFALKKKPTRVQIVRDPKAGILRFIIVSKRSASRFDTVVDWGRDYQEAAAHSALGKNVKISLEKNPLTSFVDKARRIILKSREIRSPTTTGHLGPTLSHSTDGQVSTRETGETLSDDDQMITEFLWDTCIRSPTHNRTRTIYNSITSLIIRAIGAYPKLRLERKIGRLLLQELGVLSPWSDEFDHDLLYPTPSTKGSHELDSLQAEARAACDELWLHDPGYLPELDSMASLRHDFDLPALCVDSDYTKVRDDAYSLEPNPSIPGTHWVHVHVSHPSAFIKPDHPASQFAAKTIQTWYTVYSALPMLPFSLSKAMSLDTGRPALTVSTLLKEDGKVLDIKLQPTILKDVVILNAEAVDATLGTPQPEYATMLLGTPTDGSITQVTDKPSQAALDAVHVHRATLQNLKTLMFSRVNYRMRQASEWPDWPHVEHDTDVRSTISHNQGPDQLSQTRHFLGDPPIYCFASPTMKWITMTERQEKESVTQNLMILAAESAGKWFADRNIPAIFNCATPHTDFPVSKLNRLGLETRRVLPVSYLSSTPQNHVFTGINQFLRFTSPLRRYQDLLAHWQADAYLRAESDASSNSGATITKYEPPFSRAQVDQKVAGLAGYVYGMTRKMNHQQIHLRLRALFRAFHFKEAQLPEKWDFLVRNVSTRGKEVEEDSQLRGSLLPFAFDAIILESRNKWEVGATINSYLPVKIELVDMSRGKVICRAVGPLQEKPHFPTPMKIVSHPVGREQTTEK